MARLTLRSAAVSRFRRRSSACALLNFSSACLRSNSAQPRAAKIFSVAMSSSDGSIGSVCNTAMCPIVRPWAFRIGTPT